MSCGQNLGNKRVVGFALAPLSTANVLEMICLFDFVRKVRCHKGGLWKTLGDECMRTRVVPARAREPPKRIRGHVAASKKREEGSGVLPGRGSNFVSIPALETPGYCQAPRWGA